MSTDPNFSKNFIKHADKDPGASLNSTFDEAVIVFYDVAEVLYLPHFLIEMSVRNHHVTGLFSPAYN